MKKPVKVWVVMLCFLICLLIATTLIIPVFRINISPHARGDAYINVSGLDMIKGLFADGSDFATQTTSVQKIYTFLGKGQVDYTQWINPVYLNVMLWTYVFSLGVGVLMLIFTILNFIGRRFSVFNVLSGLVFMIGGILVTLSIFLQNGEYITNSVIFYNLQVSFGAIMMIVVGFLYMILAPKKRI